jgi:glycine/D-amino acid oxidase-like deaminating enzyme/nitrite reductase/ring-hydroxylating ferredoxin subunit
MKFIDYIGSDISIPGKPTSIWIGTTPSTILPPAREGLEFDTIIIGGGIVGITTGLFLKEAGQKIAIIDMHQIIKDVTGHTTAKITSLHGLIYKYLIDQHGKEKAALYGEAQETAKEKIAGIIEEKNLDCDFVRKNAYTFALTDESLNQVKEEVLAAKSLKLPAEFEKEIPLRLKGIKGAVCFYNQAQFHPRKYLLSLAREIFGDGSYIFEQTRATDIKEGVVCEVITDKGKLKAKNVVVATNFPFYDKGSFFTKLTPRRSYVYAVKLRTDIPEGIFYTEDEDMYSFRSQKLEDGQAFFIGGVRHRAGQGGNEEDCYKKLEKFAKENFEISSFLYHWSTQDNSTTDRMPYIGLSPKSKNVYIATGFGGWGMTNGTVAAMLISDLILKKDNPWKALFNPGRVKPIGASGRFFSSNANVLKKYISGVLPHEFDLPTDVEYGEGKIIEFGGEKYAAYKDEDGKIHMMTPRCTHLGCVVEWNEAEKTWDCPCHGSRYSPRGQVIHGPAVRDLEEKETK